MSQNTPTAPALATISLPQVGKPNLLRILIGAGVVTFVGDACFWKIDHPGFAITVFFASVGIAILYNRPTLRLHSTGNSLLCLLLGSLLAAAIETGFTNIVMLVVLTIGLAGETYFTGIGSFWGRWISEGIAVLRAPGRVIWLGLTIAERIFTGGFGFMGVIMAGMMMVIPSLLLALFFGCLLARGNVVFEAWTDHAFAWIWQSITFDVQPWRIILWIFVAMTMLPLLRPVNVSSGWWSWTERLARFPDIFPRRIAFLNSLSILITLNLLFVVANVADGLFIWGGRSLPSGATYSGALHDGVNALTVTVLLSALVLASLFEQPLKVVQSRGLKTLAGLWIVQNLFLLLSVGLRLKNYILVYDATVERLGVAIFLVLVMIGYGLLTVKVVKDKSLSWLLGGGLLAALAVIYVTQFLNLEGWVAGYNERSWEQDPTRKLDIWYLHELGPAAWPALIRAERLGATKAWDDAHSRYEAAMTPKNQEELVPRTRFDLKHWREFSLRAWLNRDALEESADKK